MNGDTQLIVQIIALITGLIALVSAIIKAISSYIRKKQPPDGGDNVNNTHKVESSVGTANIVGDNNSPSITVNYGWPGNQPDSAPETATADDIMLKPLYTSLFAEKGHVQHERITIRNMGHGQIEGDVYLDEKCTYKLTGTFKNRILTGEFTSTGQFVDERGTINLKLIDEDILSGFCSFSKISVDFEDQIRVSPYVWIAGDNNELIHGTYQFCTNCHKENKKCCCASDEIDMPILLNNEAQQIRSQSRNNKKMRDFSHNIGQSSVRQMKSKVCEDNGMNIKACHFYDIETNTCRIYNTRPTDCRLFPFDIKLDRHTNEYWLGYYDEICERNLPEESTMKKYAHVLRPFIFLLFPFANIITLDSVCEKLKDAHFVKLYRLNEFIF